MKTVYSFLGALGAMAAGVAGTIAKIGQKELSN